MSGPAGFADPIAAGDERLGESPPLVLIGGSGRSGTHVIAQLLDRHPRYASFPYEARFHAKPRGFPDLLNGVVSRDAFVRKLRRFWWKRIAAGQFAPALLPSVATGRKQLGLHRAIPKAHFDTAVERFEAAYDDENEAACRRLFIDLLWPTASDRDRPGLVEMTTDNVMQGATLTSLFPEARFILTVRDGRDAGASKVERRQRPHHPTDPFGGVDWWLERMLQVERGLAEIPADKVHVISLDALVGADRGAVYSGLQSFLSLPHKRSMRRFFLDEMSPSSAHRERWREGLDRGEQLRLCRHYEAALERLEREGSRTAPILRASL